MVSTNDLSVLPAPEELMRVSQSIALLDAILEPTWDLRYFSFDAAWGGNKKMASMRDGSGSEYFAVFSPHGTILIAHAHGAALNRLLYQEPARRFALTEGIPDVFREELQEPAFTVEEATFIIWQTGGTSTWQATRVDADGGAVEDGSAGLLFMLDGRPETYRAWAEDYFGVSLEPEPIRRIYEHTPLTEALVQAIHPEAILAELAEDLREIGYPVGP